MVNRSIRRRVASAVADLSDRLGTLLDVSESLFDVPGEHAAPEHGLDAVIRRDSGAPLAVRMRPQSLDEVIGQQHLLGPGSPLRRLVEGSGAASVLLYGPPGTGKTTLASLLSQATGRRFEALSALSAGVKEVRAVIDVARRRLTVGEQTVLFIDEVHRFSKTQQDALLAAVENRIVLLVGATTENPSFSVVSPLLSRSLVLQLQSLTPDDIRQVLVRAIADPRGLDGQYTVAEDALDHIVRIAGGDARRALTALEASAESSLDGIVDMALVEASVDKAAVRYDRAGDQHYDVISAFIKSMRGSDADAALHYLARMIEAGEDPRFIARRIVIFASEDVGMADPTCLQTAVATAQAVQLIGLPEGQINLAQAVIHCALAPKSNAVVKAIGAAIGDVRRGLIGQVPSHLRDAHYPGAAKLGHGEGYKYPHDYDHGLVRQDYAPEQVRDRRYYEPTRHGAEAPVAERWSKIRDFLRGS